MTSTDDPPCPSPRCLPARRTGRGHEDHEPADGAPTRPPRAEEAPGDAPAAPSSPRPRPTPDGLYHPGREALAVLASRVRADVDAENASLSSRNAALRPLRGLMNRVHVCCDGVQQSYVQFDAVSVEACPYCDCGNDVANWRIASTSRVRKTLRDFLKGGGEGGKVVIAGQASGDFSEFRPMYSLNSVHPLVAVAHLVSTTSGHSLFGPVSDLTAADEEALVAASLSSGRGPHDEFLLPGGRELSPGAVFSPHAISADWSRDMRESLAVLQGRRGDGGRRPGGTAGAVPGRGSLIGEAVRRDRGGGANANANASNAVVEAKKGEGGGGGGGGRSKKKGGKKNRGNKNGGNRNGSGGGGRRQAINLRGAAAPPASCVPAGGGKAAVAAITAGGDDGPAARPSDQTDDDDGDGGLRRSVLEAAGDRDYLSVHLPENRRLRDENRSLLVARDRVDSVRFRPVYGHHVPPTAACAECRLSRGRLLLEEEQLTWSVGLRDGGGGGDGEELLDGNYLERCEGKDSTPRPRRTSFPLGDLKSMRLVVSGVPLSALSYRTDAVRRGGAGGGGGGGPGGGRPPGRPLAINFEGDATLLGRVRCDALPDRTLMSDAFRNVLHGVLYGPPAGTAGGAGGGRGAAPGPVVLEVDEVRFDHANVRETLERLGGAGLDVSGGGDGDDPDAVAIEADLGDLERRVMALLAGPGTGLGQELGRIGS